MASKKTSQTKEKSKSFWETFPGILTGVAAILTAIGSLVVALVTAGVINPDDATYIQPTSSIHNSSLTSKAITITLTNRNCVAQDYYVDDVKVITLNAGETGDFQTTAGEHNTYSCIVDTKSCAISSNFNWIDTTSHFIAPGEGCLSAVTPSKQMITVTLKNQNCEEEDFYVDGEKVSTVKADSEAQFQILAGEHDTYICYADTQSCGTVLKVNWRTSIEPVISRGQNCP